jgi:hypothetical protein
LLNRRERDTFFISDNASCVGSRHSATPLDPAIRHVFQKKKNLNKGGDADEKILIESD